MENYTKLLGKVAYFDQQDKRFFLEGAKIDEGIKDVCDAINEINCLVTINSCQGGGAPYPDSPHCPITYVDFYVLEHKYEVVEAMFIYLTNKFGSNLECSLSFEESGYLDEEGFFISNGYVNYRHRIGSVDRYDKDFLTDVAQAIRDFKRRYFD